MVHTCDGFAAAPVVTNLQKRAFPTLVTQQVPLCLTMLHSSLLTTHCTLSYATLCTLQFLKVELVRVTTAAASSDDHEALTGHAEAILKALKVCSYYYC
jgi:hypothetical protein